MANKPTKPDRKPPAPPVRPRGPEHSGPEITLRRAPLGRETLAAIDDDLRAPPPAPFRAKLETLAYEERPKRKQSMRPPVGSSPEVIVIGEAPVGRETQIAIEEELTQEFLAVTAGAAVPAAKPSLEPSEVFEIATFVVRGDEIYSKASDQARRDFVEERMLHRLPVLSMKDVVRIDVSRGAEPKTVILRVWCRVAPPRRK